MGTGRTFAHLIGFHCHKGGYDASFWLEGKLNVWTNDPARSLYPGDFASVPPDIASIRPIPRPCLIEYLVQRAGSGDESRERSTNIKSIHNHTGFIGLIILGGWDGCFRFISESYFEPPLPTADHRSPVQSFDSSACDSHQEI
ncbi:uncharacterized protein BP5553_01280 [Venustampulla echinocandica]|uniref:Uncharacterized protein n=1 Tax=Venustampulla echinocandica TaxID=2656787 RepID=A0A370U0J7_9HELO|nr:uncharacterized protein BP5553_01280 [Venustampulla echinocandica]RDL41301.1 hypothetical protein BP5553_01280 [Venustampulla echinocandica]